MNRHILLSISCAFLLSSVTSVYALTPGLRGAIQDVTFKINNGDLKGSAITDAIKALIPKIPETEFKKKPVEIDGIIKQLNDTAYQALTKQGFTLNSMQVVQDIRNRNMPSSGTVATEKTISTVDTNKPVEISADTLPLAPTQTPTTTPTASVLPPQPTTGSRGKKTLTLQDALNIENLNDTARKYLSEAYQINADDKEKIKTALKAIEEGIKQAKDYEKNYIIYEENPTRNLPAALAKFNDANRILQEKLAEKPSVTSTPQPTGGIPADTLVQLFTNKSYTHDKILALMNAIPMPRPAFDAVYMAKTAIGQDWRWQALKTLLEANFEILSDHARRNPSLLSGYYAAKLYVNQFENNVDMLKNIKAMLKEFLNTDLSDGKKVVNVIAEFEKSVQTITPTTIAVGEKVIIEIDQDGTVKVAPNGPVTLTTPAEKKEATKEMVKAMDNLTQTPNQISADAKPEELKVLIPKALTEWIKQQNQAKPGIISKGITAVLNAAETVGRAAISVANGSLLGKDVFFEPQTIKPDERRAIEWAKWEQDTSKGPHELLPLSGGPATRGEPLTVKRVNDADLQYFMDLIQECSRPNDFFKGMGVGTSIKSESTLYKKTKLISSQIHDEIYKKIIANAQKYDKAELCDVLDEYLKLNLKAFDLTLQSFKAASKLTLLGDFDRDMRKALSSNHRWYLNYENLTLDQILTQIMGIKDEIKKLDVKNFTLKFDQSTIESIKKTFNTLAVTALQGNLEQNAKDAKIGKVNETLTTINSDSTKALRLVLEKYAQLIGAPVTLEACTDILLWSCYAYDVYLYKLYAQLEKVTGARTWREYLTSFVVGDIKYDNTDEINKTIEAFADNTNKFLTMYKANLNSDIASSYNGGILDVKTRLITMRNYTIDDKVYAAINTMKDTKSQVSEKHKKEYVSLFSDTLKVYSDLKKEKEAPKTTGGVAVAPLIKQ